MLEIGARGSARATVTGADLAEALNQTPDDAFPSVYATSRMIGLMELAAARAMRPILREGELSVGVTLNVSHAAATPIGVEVSAEAAYLGMQGKLHRFEVVARDQAGEIGRGMHDRAVVTVDRLMQGAAKRLAGRPALGEL